MNLIKQALEERETNVNRLMRQTASLMRRTRKLRFQTRREQKELNLATENISILKVEELNLSERTKNTLMALRISRLGDFKKFSSEKDLKTVLTDNHPSCGEDCVAEIIALFNEFREWKN